MGIRPNNKLWYYTKAVWSTLMPHWWCRLWRKRLMAAYDRMTDEEKREIDQRVDYYCLAREREPLTADNSTLIGEHTQRNKQCHSVYFYDTYRYTRCYPADYRWHHEAGDVYYATETLSICKSRPVGAVNNVLINQDRVRHFRFINDPFLWENKKSMILFRGACHCKPYREQFLKMYVDHPMCNVRDFCDNSTNPPEWRDMKGMSMYQHLSYRYIMCLEGNDVASNLKWVMSTNSIAVMPRPKKESWFMEGQLIPDYHYLMIADDYHDLIEKVEYMEQHPDKAKLIIAHAHEWCRRFQNQQREDIVALKTFDKYFSLV